ncbi:2-hydroxyacid dehydrogenase [Mesorhizobium sp. PUT5]|uniref:2-hydroxyacid dehydrogenase n=1 Tax=Mesorhizobium sp. PUT5 TaxID=3454629 RepID=UPI003FA47DE5
MKPTIVITSRYPDDLLRELSARATLVQGTDQARAMPRKEVLAAVDEAIAIVNQGELRIDAELLDRAPRLRLVANAAAGFNNMNVSEMRKRNVQGTNCPDAFASDTANHAIGLLLAATRQLIEADRYVRSGAWARDGWKPGGRWDGMSLTGKRLGIVGFGHIGREVAKRAEAFGLVVSHHGRKHTGVPGWLPLDELLTQSDIVSLHCPLNEDTHHLIDAKALARMKPGSVLINVSRGPVVKMDDLVGALVSGHIGAVGLDVFEFEPEVPEALFSMPNAVLSPHMAGCTAEARRSAWELCIANVTALLDGSPALSPAFVHTS